MQIPISNLYYILSYAWGYLQEADIPHIDGEARKEPVNLFAHILANHVERLNKMGLQRGYILVEEEGNRLRGKLDVTRTLSRALLRTGKVACRFDEFSSDILPNQIIKTTALRLLTDRQLDKELGLRLRSAISRWTEISEIDLNSRCFSIVTIQRQNKDYGFLMKACELVHRALMPVGASGSFRFTEFVRDEVLMRKVFESFVRNFFKMEQNRFSVKSETMVWEGEEICPGAKAFLPVLKTDVSLSSESRKVVIEVKYVPGALISGQFEKETIRSAHLYQLVSYLSNLHARDRVSPDGILLYPAITEKPTELSYKLLGHNVKVRTLNLNRSWDEIRNQMFDLLAA